VLLFLQMNGYSLDKGREDVGMVGDMHALLPLLIERLEGK